MKKRSLFRVSVTLLFVLALVLSISAGALAADSGGYVVVNNKTTVDMATTYTVDTAADALTSYNKRLGDEFCIGYFIQDGSIVPGYSLLANSVKTVKSLNLNLKAYGPAFTAVVAKGSNTKLSLTGSIYATDDGDGTYASDFTGLGSLIMAVDGATVNANNMKIYTKGFLRSAFILDASTVTVRNSNITTMGANPLTEAYDGYKNSADQNIMLSPPWVLGIQGGARSTNLLGDKSTLSVINSKVTSGGWAVLSTDAGQNPVINVVDSTLQILPKNQGGMSSGDFDYSTRYGSGYGTYFIGNTTGNFYGAKITGTTYAGIFTGGTGTYSSSSGPIKLMDANGGKIATLKGNSRKTQIDSVFGFMTHGGADITVNDGTIVKTEEATFLYKAGDAIFTADGAKLMPDSGIILQMMDNDDTTVGVAPGPPGPPVFNTEFFEDAGWPSANGNVTQTEPGIVEMPAPPWAPPGTPPSLGPNYNTVNLNLIKGSYAGNVYNGTGYYNQVGDALAVNISDHASLKGVISTTETRHIDENGQQNTHFTINEYYYLGHVANMVSDAGYGTIAVNIGSGSTWTVTGKSILNSLTVNGKITAPSGYKLVVKVDGHSTNIVPGHPYEGNIVLTIVKGK